MTGVTLRRATPTDEPFLLEVYAGARRDELAATGWTAAQTDAFLRMQHDAQLATYRARHPRGAFLIVQRDGRPVGRLFLAVLDGHLRVVDLAVLPAWRGAGTGTAVLGAVLAGADAAGRRVSLHVERGSRAVGLYERLGFSRVGGDAVYLLLERPARDPQLNTAS